MVKTFQKSDIEFIEGNDAKESAPSLAEIEIKQKLPYIQCFRKGFYTIFHEEPRETIEKYADMLEQFMPNLFLPNRLAVYYTIADLPDGLMYVKVKAGRGCIFLDNMNFTWRIK